MGGTHSVNAVSLQMGSESNYQLLRVVAVLIITRVSVPCTMSCKLTDSKVIDKLMEKSQIFIIEGTDRKSVV